MSVTEDIKHKFKPVLNMVSIQTNAAKDVMREQMSFVGECFKVSKRHTESLRENSDISSMFRMPVDAGREITNSWITTAGRQWDILVEARSALNGEGKQASDDIAATVAKAKVEPEPSAAKADPSSGKR